MSINSLTKRWQYIKKVRFGGKNNKSISLKDSESHQRIWTGAEIHWGKQSEIFT